MIGVQFFHVYSDHSIDNIEQVLAPFIAAGVASFTRLDYFQDEEDDLSVQRLAYEHTLHVSKYKWIAFIDIDEYITIKPSADNVNRPCLPKFLADYEEFGGLAVNWRLYGHSGAFFREQIAHLPCPFAVLDYGGGNRGGASFHIKTIVQREHTLRPICAHNFVFKVIGLRVCMLQRLRLM